MTQLTNVRITSNVHDACARERDELRAEIERLHAENIALRDGRAEAMEDARLAQAELEPLRAALRKHHGPTDSNDPPCPLCGRTHQD
jgi:hypothetical protein